MPIAYLLTGGLGDFGGGGGGGGGSGANTVTITVTDDTQSPLQGATVTAKINGITSGTGSTDVDGVVLLALDDATYTVNVTCFGFNGTVETLEVDGDTEADYELASVVITPSEQGTVTGYGYTYAADGSTIQAGVTVSIQMTKIPAGNTGVIDPRELTTTSDENGLFQFTGLRPYASYSVLTDRGAAAKTVVAQASNFAFPAVIA